MRAPVVPMPRGQRILLRVAGAVALADVLMLWVLSLVATADVPGLGVRSISSRLLALLQHPSVSPGLRALGIAGVVVLVLAIAIVLVLLLAHRGRRLRARDAADASPAA